MAETEELMRAVRWSRLSLSGVMIFSLMVAMLIVSAPTASAATQPVVPGAPTDLQAVATSQQVSLTWVAPQSQGASPILSYLVKSSPGTATCSTSGSLGCTVTGLTNGSAYKFSVSATNSQGTGKSSAKVSVKLGLPGPPTDVVGIAGSSLVTVQWQPPAGDAIGVTAYTVKSTPTSKGCKTTGATTCTVGKLTNGTHYTFMVKATFGKFSGPESAASAPVTPSLKIVTTLPVGTDPAGISSDGDPVWVANEGSNSVTEFDVSGALVQTIVANGVNNLSAPDAIYSDGSNVWVANSGNNSVTEFTVGGALVGNVPVGNGPDAITSNGTDAWVANGVDGTVTEIDESTDTVVGSPISVGNDPDAISAKGADVWVANAADNTVTEIDASAGTVVGNPIPVGNDPDAISSDGTYVWVANATDNTVTVIDAATGSVVGAPIPVGDDPAGISSDGIAVWVAISADNTVTELDASNGSVVGTPINVGVDPDAISSDGNNVWVADAGSASVTVLAIGTPSAPTDGAADPASSTSESVSFSPPLSDGGTAIIKYTVAVTDVTSPGTTHPSVSGAASPILITGLVDTNQYTFTVTAENGLGYGSPSASIGPVSPGVLPSGPTVNWVNTVDGSDAQVAYIPSSSAGSSPITDYVVVATDNSNPAVTPVTVSSLANPIDVPGLVPADEFTYTVAAESFVGTGPASPPYGPIAQPEDLPGAPSTPTAALGGTDQAVVSFVPPSFTGGATSLYYEVLAYDVTAGTNGYFPQSLPTVVGSVTSITVDDLNAGDTYYFTVEAGNETGWGPWSPDSNNVTMPLTVPVTLSASSATGGYECATVTFSPGGDGGTPIVSYTVTATDSTNPANGGQSVVVSSSPASVCGLTDGDSYTFSVTATNAIGTSVPSPPSNSVVPTPYVQTVAAGREPWSITSDGQHVWVTNLIGNGIFNGSVTEYDAPSGTVVQTIPVSGFPEGISSDGTDVWVADAWNNRVDEIQCSTGDVIGETSVPQGLVDVSSNGTDVWTANSASNSVTEIDASTGAIVREIGGMDYPIAISAKGAYVWVANEDGNSATQIDAATGDVVQTVPVGQTPESISTDGTNVWIGNTESQTVTELSATTGAVANSAIALPQDGGPTGISSDGANVWVLEPDVVVELSAATGVVEQSVGTGGYDSIGIPGIFSDGTDVWVANSGSNNITELIAT
jgi:YVTN family beta-propeller protein